MLEEQGFGMELQPVGSRKGVCRCIEIVAQYRVPKAEQMHAQLMRAPGHWMEP